MKKVITILLSILTFSALAEDDPCSNYTYPIQWMKEIEPASSYVKPAIYTERNGIKTIISVAQAKVLVSQGISEHKPFLKAAKQHMLKSLTAIKPNKLVNVDELLMDMEGLQGREWLVPVHVMVGYQTIFLEALLENIAAIQINDALVTKAKAAFIQGRIIEEDKSITIVNNTFITHKDKLVHQYCWLDSDS